MSQLVPTKPPARPAVVKTASFLLTFAFAVHGGEVQSAGGKLYEVRCKEPLPVFTLGEKSNPTKAQEGVLCTCIWQNLGNWEREVSEKIAKGKESEISQMHLRAFPLRFGSALEKCGGMTL